MITDLEEAHLHSVSLSTWFLVELEFGNVGFRGEGKTLVPGEKPLGTRERTNNKLNPRMSSTPGFSPAPQVTGWEACKCSQHFAIPVHRTRGMNMLYGRLFFPLFYTKKIGLFMFAEILATFYVWNWRSSLLQKRRNAGDFNLKKYIFKTQFSSHTIMKLRLLSTQKLKKNYHQRKQEC